MSMTDTENAEQQAAVDRVNECVKDLMQTGYQFVVLSIAKVVRLPDGTAYLPGATLFEAVRSVAPGLPNLARGLRTVADQVDEAFRRIGAAEAPRSYSHLIEAVNDENRLGTMSDAERKVLIAMDAISDALLLSWIEASQVTRGLPRLAIMELARRRAHKEG